ncbi:MAG: imelysin family protein [Bacteroidota bacterium]
MKRHQHLPVLLLGLLLISSCANEGRRQAAFSRKDFLSNYANQIIRPSANVFAQKASQLKQAVAQLKEEKSVDHLQRARIAWDETYRAWTEVSMFNFGPGGSERRRRTLLEEVGTWPINIKGIENKIKNPDHDFNDSKRNTRGLLTAAYLLFSPQTEGTWIDESGDEKISYLEKTVNHLNEHIQNFNSAWQGDYANEFIAADGTDVKSSTTQLFNELVRNFEVIRDTKLGIPMGLIAGQSSPQPELAESPFSEQSLDYLLLNYQIVIKRWRGTNADGTDGPGWEEYLLSTTGGESLVKEINAQFAQIATIIEQIPKEKSLKTLALENNPELVALHRALQKLTRFLKGDSSSLLGLAITFSSGDGD